MRAAQRHLRLRGPPAAEGRPGPARTVFMCCDVQEKLLPHIYRGHHVAATSAMLCRAASLLDVDVVATEQVPEKLGATVAPVAKAMPEKSKVFSKKLFSMWTPEVRQWLGRSPGQAGVELDTQSDEECAVVVFGCETHVCVLQSVLDLLQDRDASSPPRGLTVVVVVDAVSSIRALDRSVALRRMEQAGAVLMTAESVVFDLMRTAEHDAFRQVSKLVKDTAAEIRALDGTLDSL
eukprot:TRINITY_DN56014_c0_g1_i1.p1 TRINITY_DN56014_c0_g1~~TRINITY_DN56014_c0_g1_i1.p1  ORF type:complete len:262 (+),score=85.17 TRINITY_DN56014_c0_g1_i1:82-786(+)